MLTKYISCIARYCSVFFIVMLLELTLNKDTYTVYLWLSHTYRNMEGVCALALCVCWCNRGRSWTGAPLRSGNQTVALVSKLSAALHRGHSGSSSLTAYTHPRGNRCMHSYTNRGIEKKCRIGLRPEGLDCYCRDWIRRQARFDRLYTWIIMLIY